MHPDDFAVIVPARLPATRLPNKPLADIGGVPLIVRVLQQASAAGATQVAAACAAQDATLIQAVQQAGFTAIGTGEHDSGSSRIAEAAAALNLPPDAIVLNVQGDEPFIEPHIITNTARLAAQTPCVCATPCRPLANADEYANPAIVKVVANKQDRALYFSRAPIPHQRDSATDNSPPPAARAHLGLYAYRHSELQRLLALPPAPQEQCEQLEQLRILWHGGTILLHHCHSQSFGIDTPEDLQRARARIAAATA